MSEENEREEDRWRTVCESESAEDWKGGREGSYEKAVCPDIPVEV